MPPVFWDGYLDWSRTIEEARTPGDPYSAGNHFLLGSDIYEPVFIHLLQTPSAHVLAAVHAYLTAPQPDGATPPPVDLTGFTGFDPFANDPDVIVDIFDLLVGLEHTMTAQAPLEFFIYRKIDPARDPAAGVSGVYSVIDVGAPTIAQTPRLPARVIEHDAAAPPIEKIAAVIDNDIGFLNRRFRKDVGAASEQSRFHAIWLQAREGDAAFASTPVGTAVGRVVMKEEIDGWLSTSPPRSERSVYAELNQTLHRFDEFKLAPKVDTHGTAVADLAFGLDPEDNHPEADMPLLAVQLPPEAARDTSGTVSENYIVQGVRWLCARARELDPSATLVINLSYGVVAGAKNGSTFLEAQVAEEIALARAYGQTVEIVYAYGNGCNERQIAKVTVPPNQKSEPLTWVIHPDSRAPAYMEVRQLGEVDGKPSLVDLTADIGIHLTPPEMCQPKFEANPTWGTFHSPTPTDGSTISPYRVYAVPARPMASGTREDLLAYYCVSMAPTRRFSSDMAPTKPGDWTVELFNTGDTPVEVVLQIQRGDTGPGANFGGRQSYFQGAFEWREESGIAVRDVKAPLTNEGSNSRYTTGKLREAAASMPEGKIHTVGAQEAVAGTNIKADYSPVSAPWLKVAGPTAYAVVDGMATSGKVAAGTYSGTRVRLSGTSAAAALHTRSLLGLG